MKIVTSFLLVAVLINSCAYNRIKLGPKHKLSNRSVQRQSDRSAAVETEKLVSIDLTDDYDLQEVEKVTNPALNESDDVSSSKEKKVVQNIISRIEENYPEIDSELSTLKEKSARSNGRGASLLIFGLVLMLVCVLFIVMGANGNISINSADGCLTSIIQILAMIILGVIFGLGGVILFIIGLVIMTTDNKSRSSQSEKSSEEHDKKAPEEKAVEKQSTINNRARIILPIMMVIIIGGLILLSFQ